jgi:hypothetical protein
MENRLALVVGLLACSCGGESSPGLPDAGPPEGPCPSPEILAVLDDHIAQLGASGEMPAGHPGEREATAFFLFPGLESGTAAILAGPLVMSCSSAISYDEYCGKEEGYCSQIECTGEGASWIMHLRLAGRLVIGEWELISATVDNHWAEGQLGTTFTIAADITGPGGTDFSFSGEGTMDPQAVMITETYPSLLGDGSLTVTFTETPTSHAGQVTVDGDLVATADPGSGLLVLSGRCQP